MEMLFVASFQHRFFDQMKTINKIVEIFEKNIFLEMR